MGEHQSLPALADGTELVGDYADSGCAAPKPPPSGSCSASAPRTLTSGNAQPTATTTLSSASTTQNGAYTRRFSRL
jgi:hypothetical protein